MGNSILKHSGSQQLRLEQGEFLLNGFKQLFENQTELAAINQRFGSDQKLRILCYQISEYPTLIEHFITASSQSQSFFERSLFCSWFSFLIAGRLRLSVMATKEIFVAGLAQDLSARSLESHASGSVECFLDDVPRLSEQIKLIASEHLERFDGTGAPAGKVESLLTQVSQVLIVSNEVFDLLQQNKRPDEKALNFSKILPLLRLNTSVYFRGVYSEATTLAMEASKSPVSNHRLNISSIIEAQGSLLQRWPYIVKASAELITLPAVSIVISLRAISRRSWVLVTSAGVLSKELSLWLSQLDDFDNETEEKNIQVVTELEMLLEDLDGMLSHFHQLLERLLQNAPSTISPLKHSKLSDLCDALRGEEESFDLDDFTLLNMCD